MLLHAATQEAHQQQPGKGDRQRQRIRSTVLRRIPRAQAAQRPHSALAYCTRGCAIGCIGIEDHRIRLSGRIADQHHSFAGRVRIRKSAAKVIERIG